MKKNNKEESFLSPFFVLRFPLLPFNNLVDFYEESINLDFKELFDKLSNSKFADIKLKEALYLATPVLYNELIKYQTLPDSFNKRDSERLFYSLFKYFARASSRCTPFGMFAGCVAGSIGEITDIKVSSGSDTIRHLRLDMDYLCNLAKHLCEIKDIKEQLNYFPNTSLYRLNKKIRYVEYRFNSANTRSHHLVNIDSEDVLNFILKICKNGMHYSKIIEHILDQYDISRREVIDFVNALIENRTIQSSLEPNVTGEEYFTAILKQLGTMPNQTAVIKSIMATLVEIDREIQIVRHGTSDLKNYHTIQQLLSRFETPFKEERLFQMDTVKKHSGITIANELVDQVRETVVLLSKFTKHSGMQNSTLETFKRAFRERYENATVKLTDVLDSEIGIGYKSSKSVQDYYNSASLSDEQMNQFRLYKFKEYLSGNDKEAFVSITDADVEKFFGKKKARLPMSFNTMINLYSSDRETPSNNSFEILTISPSPSSLLGRFCHADIHLKEELLKLISVESDLYKDGILAEIAHLPQSRIGNILSRPHLRQYEIEYLAKSTLPENQRISIDDLYLYLRNDELILYSKRLKKRILPRLASAHNFSFASLSTYHLLCDLQYQGNVPIQTWNWGELSSEIFLPRVVYKTAILSTARWVINKTGLGLSQKSDYEEFKTKFEKFIDEFRMPEYVIHNEGDNKLLLNISSPIGINQVYQLLKKNSSVILSESVWNKITKQTVNEKNSHNVYTNEIIIPFVKNIINEGDKQNTKEHLPRILAKKAIQRSFFPGSEWLYIKIYSKDISFNSILTKVFPFVKKAKKANLKKWFFIRYADPKPHLRLRFQLSSSEKSTEFLSDFNKALKGDMESGKIYNMTVDTYVREVERYGELTMEQSESIFDLNSDLVCSIICANSKNTDGLALSFVDFMVRTFITDINGRFNFYEKMFNSYAQEFNFDNNKQIKESFQNQFRAQTKDINSIIDQGPQKIFENVKMANQYLSGTDILIKEIIDKLEGKDNGITENDLLASYIHMFINRLENKEQRFKEFFIYYCLFRYYKSKTFTLKTTVSNV